MSLRANGSYIGPRPTGPSSAAASGIWDLRTVERQRAANNWPGQPITDPDFANVSLLLHMDGSGSTFTDSSGTPKTITANGNAAQTSDQSKFGGKSAYFDGNGDYLVTNSSADFDFSSTAMVIEGWFYYTGVQSAPHLWNIGLSSSNRFAAYRNPSSGVIALQNNINGSGTAVQTSYTMPVNEWFHFAVVKSGTTTRAFANGSQVASTTSLTYPSGNAAAAFGHQHFNTASGDYFSGYIDDLRVTKGTDRGYTGATITVPTAAFPDA